MQHLIIQYQNSTTLYKETTTIAIATSATAASTI